MLAKEAAEGVPLDDHDRWVSGGGIRQWAKQRKRSYLEGEEAVVGRAMGWRRKAVTNYCRLRGGKGIGRWWDEKIGRVEDAGFFFFFFFLIHYSRAGLTHGEARMRGAQGVEKRRKRRST